MSTGKIKIYKNPARKSVPGSLKPYVPQYQLLGVEPEEYHSPTSSNYRIENATKPTKAPLSKDNPREARPLIRQPYAESTSSPVGRGKGPLPNVGNNMEQTWSSVDGEIIDDLNDVTIEPNKQMIDNNDFVSAAALGDSEDTLIPEDDDMEVLDGEEGWTGQVEEEDVHPEIGAAPKTFLTEDELQNALRDELFSEIVNQLKEDDYLLLVGSTAICSGPLEDVQEQARGLVFGEHPLCDGEPIPVDDIIVMKRVKLKVGLFLE